MTNEQKYSAVLRELGELLESKNTTISCQKFQIDQLKEKLAAAEAERDAAADGLAETAAQLEALQEEMELMKGGAA